eukprot:1230912-Amphidinium_carterae.1
MRNCINSQHSFHARKVWLTWPYPEMNPDISMRLEGVLLIRSAIVQSWTEWQPRPHQEISPDIS